MPTMNADPITMMAIGSMGMALGGIVTQFANIYNSRRQASVQARQQERQSELQEEQNIMNWTTQDNIRQRADLKEAYTTIKQLEDLLRASKEEQLKQKLQLLEHERQCDKDRA